MLGIIDIERNSHEVILSKYGIAVENEISKIPQIYNAVEIKNYVIMPNHVHLLIAINQPKDGMPQSSPAIPRVIKQLKGSITKSTGFSLWQKSFYDHVIRSKAEYLIISQYIDLNPIKWKFDCFFME